MVLHKNNIRSIIIPCGASELANKNNKRTKESEDGRLSE
jgi:hypothetical protein